MKLQRNLFLLLIVLSTKIFSQDIKGAYIRTAWVPTFTYTYAYNYTVTVLTDIASNNNRPQIPVNFIFTSNISTYSLCTYSEINNVGVSTYTGTYTYGGAGYYPMYYLDTFKVASINNLSSSQTQSVLATCKQYLYNSNNSWRNISCRINNFPPHLSVFGNKVLYDPMVTDAEGDSLSYSLINCYNTTSYYIPSDVTISPSTGVMSLSKDSLGVFAFAMEIREWKKNTSGTYQLAQVTGVDFVIDIDATVGIKKTDLKNSDIRLYPNPIIEKLNLDFHSPIISETKITIGNSLGQIVYSLNNVSQKQELDLSFLTSGIYFLKIENISGQKVFKVIKE